MSSARIPARGLFLVLGLSLVLAGCQEEKADEAPELRPVRTVVVEKTEIGQIVTLSGTVESQVEVDFAFRIGGRLVERLVGLGDTVAPGQVIGRLDPADEENALRGAEAARAAAVAQLSEARSNYERQRTLFERDIVSAAGLERAEQVFTSATSAFDNAEAQVGIAQRRLNDTVLQADAGGVVIAVGAEGGEVVSAGRRIVQVARDEGKDAVFDVPVTIVASSPSDPEVTVRLSINPGVTAMGRIREVAPRADPATGTIRVRVGLIDPPAEMLLGSTVTGVAMFGSSSGIEIPASALTSAEGKPSVWVVDPATNTVALRSVEVTRFAPSTVGIAYGLTAGDRIVTAGVQAMRPGQEVRLLGEGS